jgi:ribonuclease H2 subunit A
MTEIPALTKQLSSPQAISRGMLSRPPVNLNTQSQDATISLLSALLAHPYSLPITEVYVDALGPAEKYQAYLQSRFPSLQITVRNKADSIYKIVGAASVAAKVTRDFLIEDWIWEEAMRNQGVDGEATWGKGSSLGSGYPSDPNTKEWISSHLEKTFGFPTIARFSWAPIRLAMESKGHKVEW